MDGSDFLTNHEHSSSTTPITFPKIVALHGADTSLGQIIFRDLLNSTQVDKLHAIALAEFGLLDQLPRSSLRKAQLTITKPGRLELALGRISECDIAFCVMSTDRHAGGTMSKETFSAINYDAPIRFIFRMFELGVLHIAVLSHVNADPDSSSEFYRFKGKLEDSIRKLRREAGDFAPMVTFFKMRSHIMAPSGSSASRAVSRDRRGREADARHVRVEELAVAMQIDAFYKAGIKGPPGSRKKKCHFEIFDSEDVHRILQENEYHESWLSPV